MEQCLYTSNTDIVKAMNAFIQKRHNHRENCITVEVSPRTQKIETYLGNERFGLAFLSTDLGHIFAIIIGNEFGVTFGGKRLHKPEFAYEIVRIQSLMIYTDRIEYNILGDTKAPLLHCILSISMLKAGDKITTGEYKNYQEFKKFFHSIHFDLRDMRGEKKPFVSVGIADLVLMFRKASNILF